MSIISWAPVTPLVVLVQRSVHSYRSRFLPMPSVLEDYPPLARQFRMSGIVPTKEKTGRWAKSVQCVWTHTHTHTHTWAHTHIHTHTLSHLLLPLVLLSFVQFPMGSNSTKAHTEVVQSLQGVSESVRHWQWSSQSNPLLYRWLREAYTHTHTNTVLAAFLTVLVTEMFDEVGHSNGMRR